MRKYIVIPFCIFIFCHTNLLAQKPEKVPIKFGTVNPEDFKKVYSVDSSAQAVIIADRGVSKFVGNNNGWFSLEFSRKTRIHILNKAAYDVATISVPIYKSTSSDSKEELLNVKATTYNLENGKVTETKMGKNSIFADKLSKNNILEKFTLPNLKEGCIIEFEYEINSDFLRNLQPWAFQGNYPVLWSEYEVGIPDFFAYIFLTQGYQSFYIRDTKSRADNFSGRSQNSTSASDRFSFTANVDEHRMVMKDVPALKRESFTSTINNHIAKIEFQLSEFRYPLSPQRIMGTWKQLDEELMKAEYFGQNITRNNNFLDDEIPLSAKLIKENNLQKAKLIYEHVRDNYTCTDHWAYGMNQNFKNMLKVKNGSVAEINMMLISMLRNLGYKADPVIIGLRSRGVTYSLYPIIERFNYLVVELNLDGKKYYLDASEPMNGFGKLDPDCYNGHARVINGGPQPIEFNPDSLLERKVTSIYIINDEKGNSTGSMQQVPGYFESTQLSELIKDKGKDAMLTAIKKDFNAEIEIENLNIDSLNLKDNPIGISYDFKLNNDKEDIIYLNPMFGERYETNPFKSAERVYPVEMPYTEDETYIFSMEVPTGYVVDELPKSMVLKLNEFDDGLFEYRMSVSDNTISFRCRLRIKRTFFAPDEYELLREFFGMVVAKQNEQIVFKKKK